MLATCGNPKCNRRFMRLSEGKLFWQQEEWHIAGKTPEVQMHMVWFCDFCAVTVDTILYHREIPPSGHMDARRHGA